MSLPTHFDTRRGIRKWFTFGNLQYGDCVIAAFLHLLMVHNLAKASSWKKLLYKIGFRVPTNEFSIEEYTEFLATLGEKPSGTMGVAPSQFFPWLQAKGIIQEWEQIPLETGLMIETIHEAVVDWTGCMILLNLTKRVYDEGLGSSAWILESGDSPDPSLGHAIADVEYGPVYDGIVTWGMVKHMSREFMEACVYGCYVFK